MPDATSLKPAQEYEDVKNAGIVCVRSATNLLARHIVSNYVKIRSNAVRTFLEVKCTANMSVRPIDCRTRS